MHKRDALHNLVPLVQFKKRKNTNGGVISSVARARPATLLKENSPPWMFFTFFKWSKGYQIT